MSNNLLRIPTDQSSLGLLGYIIVINQQVHSYQIDALSDYLNNLGMSLFDSVLKAIIDGNESAVSLDECLDSFSKENAEVQISICYMLLLLSQLDNVIDEKESRFISRILCASKLSDDQKRSVEVLAGENASRYRTTNNRLFDNKYMTDAKKKTDRRVTKKHQLRKTKTSEKEISDEEYIRMISKCSDISKEDYSIVHPYYSGIIANNKMCLQNIDRLVSGLNRESELSSEVAKLVDEFSKIVKEKVAQQTDAAEELLAQKERTLPDFTISLLGRTKAGKSTLHAILTNQGYDKIGYGKQRTTRYNRVYQWNMLRIIDTPGIGSAEDAGRTDDEIALSVLGESDVVCLVVVDDSILDDVLDLMDRVSKLNKPVLILLNHKENIRNEVKYSSFISEPDKWLKDTGESNLQGHIDRITKHARDNGYEKLVKVFPVFLLAARMSNEEAYRKNAELLREKSNIDPFINHLKKLVAEAGTIKRSQTILDEAVQTLGQLNVQIDNSLQPIERHIAFLKEARIKTIKALKRDRDVTAKRVKGIIIEKGEELANEKSKVFAREAFESFEKADRNDISAKWNEFVEESGIKDELESEIRIELEKYKSQADERIKELFDDIYFNVKSEFVIPHIGVPTAVNFKKIFLICNMVMLCELVALGFLSTAFPYLKIIDIVVLVKWLLFDISTGFAKAKYKKKEVAIRKLHRAIGNAIRKTTRDQAKEGNKDIAEDIDKQIEKIDSIFEELITGLDELCIQGRNMQAGYRNSISWLDRVYAWRIAQFLNKTDEKYSVRQVNDTIKAVVRSKNTIYIGAPEKYHADASPLEGVIADKVTFVGG